MIEAMPGGLALYQASIRCSSNDFLMNEYC